jgi:hypothetical protein
VNTLLVIALVWIGASVVVTLVLTSLFRVGSRAETMRQASLAAELLGVEGVRWEDQLVVGRALEVAARRPRG